MSSTTPTSLSPAASVAARAQSALDNAAKILPDGVKDAARSVATGLASTAKETAGNILETGKTMAKDEIQNFVDMIFHRVQDALQVIHGTFPGGFGDKIIDGVGAMLSKIPLPAPAPGTNRQTMINADVLRQILKSPDTVSKQVVDDIAALWSQSPKFKAVIELCNPVELIKNPAEAWKKLSSLIGLSDEAKPAAAAASKPAAKNDKDAKPAGWFRRCINWIGSFAGPSDPKEIEQKLKGAGAIKSMWYKLPPVARKGAVYAGGAFAVLKVFTLGFLAVKIALVYLLGKGVLNAGSNFLGGKKSAETKSSGRSLLKPWTWFGGSKKASPTEEADAAVQQQSGGWTDKLKKGIGHATKLMGHAQNFQTNPMGAITGLLGGGGAAPQNA